MKKITLLGLLSFAATAFSQIGINTTSPNTQLDIRSGNQTSPSGSDGIIIPKIDAFQRLNTTSLHDGMMTYLITVSTANQLSFIIGTGTWIKQVQARILVS
jgi:hypothetical protein